MLDADLPGLRISSGDQDINQIGVNPNPTEQSTLELVIECCAKAAANIEDVLDQMAKEVQITMSANQTLAGAKRAFIKSIEPDLDGEGEKEYGVLRLTYHVLFNSAQNAPDVAT